MSETHNNNYHDQPYTTEDNDLPSTPNPPLPQYRNRFLRTSEPPHPHPRPLEANSHDTYYDASSDTYDTYDVYYDTSHNTYHEYMPSNDYGQKRPLIDLVSNQWRDSPDQFQDDDLIDDSFAYARDDWIHPKWKSMFRQHLSTLRRIRIPRRVQRYIVTYLTLGTILLYAWSTWLGPIWHERRALDKSLDKPKDVFGSNVRVQFKDMIQVKQMDKTLLPSKGRRLVFIGDVHGCKDELQELLDKIHFKSESDHLVFTGDLIAKGPDSSGVVGLAREVHASCVRGNHEDRMLLAHRDVTSTPLNDALAEELETHGDQKARKLAKSLTQSQVDWLKKCPVILEVGQVPGMGEITVAHAGLVPGVDHERQDPFQTMNMRSIDLDTKVPREDRDGTPWEKLWNRYQSRMYKNQRGTIIYGHDSKRGLTITPWAKGLDSGCVSGGSLTAMVLDVHDGKTRQELYNVDCWKQRAENDRQKAEKEKADQEKAAAEKEKAEAEKKQERRR